jgi:hypothetical protein
MNTFFSLDLSGNSPTSLIWKQLRFNEDYFELADNINSEVVYASIDWPKWLSDLAIARSAVGIWHFDRQGWTRRTITVARSLETPSYSGMDNQSDFLNIANFEVGWFWEGDLVLKNDEIFHWYRTKIFRNAWAMTEVVSNSDLNPNKKETQDHSTSNNQKQRGFFFRKRSKPVRRERLVYEIEFGMSRFKQEAWITLPTHQAGYHPMLIFLLCTGMYLGYCYNQDSAAVVAVSSTAAI